MIRAGTGALAVAQGAIAVLRDADVDDDAREKAMQQASLRMFGAFASITLRGALALALSLLPIWLASVAGLTTMERVTGFMARWDVVAITSAAMVGGFVLWTRLCPTR